MKVLQPAGWAKPKGYVNGVSARGRTISVAGMIGWDGEGRFHSDDLAEQVRQALHNVVAVLAEDDARPEHIVRMTWYVVDRDEYVARLKELGAVYREIIGRNYPVMTCVEVSRLVETRAKVEIEVTAVIPD